MRRRPRHVPLLALLLAACLLGGCTEVEESWVLDEKGGGVYTLALRWNADLWRRVTGVLGEPVMKRLQGRAVPLRPADWRAGLVKLDGVEILDLEERDTDSGMRELFVRVKFAHLRDLMRWELMARRTVRVEAVPDPDASGKDDPPLCRFCMEPIAHVPVLDPVAALIEATDKPPPAAEGAAAPRDPPPLERLGIDRKAADLVWKMVKPALAKASLTFRFQAPFDVRERQGHAVEAETREVRYAFGFDDLRKPSTDRTLQFAWKMRAFDKPPAVAHEGDRDPRHRTPEGRKK